MVCLSAGGEGRRGRGPKLLAMAASTAEQYLNCTSMNYDFHVYYVCPMCDRDASVLVNQQCSEDIVSPVLSVSLEVTGKDNNCPATSPRLQSALVVLLRLPTGSFIVNNTR